jgi:3-oxo-5-alpha-steroid 4-dehydrogenase 1
MTENQLYQIILIASFVVAVGTFIALFFISAPYGRHTRQGWGPKLPNWLSWLLMEAPSPLMMASLFLLGKGWQTAPGIVFLLMWEAHYIHRAFIYPFQRRDGSKKMPLVIALLAVVFNLGNGYTNGRYLFTFAAAEYSSSWFADPRFIIGVSLFLIGFILNRWADAILRTLRQPGTHGYQVPQGGLYRFISCPNYLGEIIEWVGWAVATWSLAGLAFAVWTISNLAPRAWAHHRWYHSQFPQYPKSRKALIPGIW